MPSRKSSTRSRAKARTPAGRRLFCRFAGCNLWSGREEDRAKAVCQFCDTDFVGTDGTGGGRFPTADALAGACRAVCPASGRADPCRSDRRGADAAGRPGLIEALHANGFTVAIETNGTLPVLDTIDWICVSPKSGADLKQRHGHELKLIYPQDGIDPADYLGLAFEYRFVQPMDGPHSLPTREPPSPTAKRTRPGGFRCRPIKCSVFLDATLPRRFGAGLKHTEPGWRRSGNPVSQRACEYTKISSLKQRTSCRPRRPERRMRACTVIRSARASSSRASLTSDTGYIFHFDDLSAAINDTEEALDHRMLNDIEGLSAPTLERMAMWIWNRLSNRVPGLCQVEVHRDSCNEGCIYRGPPQPRADRRGVTRDEQPKPPGVNTARQACRASRQVRTRPNSSASPIRMPTRVTSRGSRLRNSHAYVR